MRQAVLTRPQLRGVHHVALIASDYERSKAFYIDLLGCEVVEENYRAERSSWKLDLKLPDGTQLELFTFPGAPARPNRPEAQGLRHLSFAVESVDQWVNYLASSGVSVEAIRVDPYTQKKFTFFADPDGLPLELYQIDE